MVITYVFILPAALFSFLCFYGGPYTVSDSGPYRTLFETVFDFKSYWRIVGPFGLFFLWHIFYYLPNLIRYWNGHIQLSNDKIVVDRGGRLDEFETNKLKDFVFDVDGPFKGYDRFGFHRGSVIKFKTNNNKFDFVMSVETAKDLESLTPIVKAWKEVNNEFKYGYK